MDEEEFDACPVMDDADQQWVRQFQGEGKSIPEDAIIEGFISIISWIDPNGEKKWRSYNTIDSPLSSVLGLLEMTKYCLMTDNREVI